MNVVLTGATGFIGRAITSTLAENGARVVGLSREPDTALSRNRHLASAYGWVPAESAPPAEAFDGNDVVINLVGESVAGRWTRRKKRAIATSRLAATRHLVDRLRTLDKKPAMLVSASGIGYYGDRGDELLDESAVRGNGFLAELCEEWERESLVAKEAGIDVAIIRLGIVIGAGGGALAPMLVPFRLGLGGPLGRGRQWMSWVALQDVVNAVSFVIEHRLIGPINVTAPNSVKQRDFAAELGRALRRPAIIPTPPLALKAIFGGFAAELLSSARVVPARLGEEGFRFSSGTLPQAFELALGGS